jgi:hypothetical protein
MYTHLVKSIAPFVFFVSIFLFLFAPFVFSIDTENQVKTNFFGVYAFTLEPSVSMLWGIGDEIIYNTPNDNNKSTNKYTSELIWDMKPLICIGLSLAFSPHQQYEKSGFRAQASVKCALPIRAGITEDKDWLADNQPYLTNYSRHTNMSDGSVFADLNAGYSWAIANCVSLNLYAALLYYHLAWKAENGYIQYASGNQPWNDTVAKTDIYGPAIQYQQNWFLLTPGFDAGFRLNSVVAMKLFAEVTPFIYAKNVDNHMLASKFIQYEDYLSWGLYFKYGGGMSWKPNKHTEISFSASIQRLAGARGYGYSLNTGTYGGNVTGEYARSFDKSGGGGFLFTSFDLSAKFFF